MRKKFYHVHTSFYNWTIIKLSFKCPVQYAQFPLNVTPRSICKNTTARDLFACGHPEPRETTFCCLSVSQRIRGVFVMCKRCKERDSPPPSLSLSRILCTQEEERDVASPAMEGLVLEKRADCHVVGEDDQHTTNTCVCVCWPFVTELMNLLSQSKASFVTAAALSFSV